MKKTELNKERKEDFGTPLSAAEKSGLLINDEKNNKKVIRPIREWLEKEWHKLYTFCTPSTPSEKDLLDSYFLDRLSVSYTKAGDPFKETGIFGEALKLAAKTYHADKTLFGVNGTTGNMKTILRTFAEYQKIHKGKENIKILSSRNTHKCVRNAYQRDKIDVDYLPIRYDDKREVFLPPSPEDVKKALENEDYDAVVLTCPTYEGFVPDLEKIVEISHKHNIPVIVDEAWGAHLGFTEKLPKSAMQCGADICAQSTHKQGGSGMNQTSMIHMKYGILNEEFTNLLKRIHYDDESTTSPYWGMFFREDEARADMEEYGKKRLEKTIRLSNKFRKKVNEIDGLYTCNKKEILKEHGKKHGNYVHDIDPTKVVIDTTKSGISGDDLNHYLQNDFNIVSEKCDTPCITFLIGLDLVKQPWKIDFCADAIERTVKRYKPKENHLNEIRAKYPKEVIKIAEHYEVYNLPDEYKEFVPLEESIGRILAENRGAYPPGFDVVKNGEISTVEHVEYIKKAKNRNTHIYTTAENNHYLEMIYVVKENAEAYKKLGIEIIEGTLLGENQFDSKKSL